MKADLPSPKRTAFLLGALFLVDLGFMGQGLVSLLIAALGVLLLPLGTLVSIIRQQRPRAANRATRAAIYLVLGAATLGTLRFHARVAATNAARLIAACQAYQAKHGQYPKQLEDLVPGHLPSVPRAKYVMAFGQFSYWATPESHTLLYVALPPSGRRLYHFEEARWSRLD